LKPLKPYRLGRQLVPVLLWVAVLAVLLSGAADAASGRDRWRARYFPNVPLVTSEGETVRFYDDLIKDKVVAINFIFTDCKDVCPAETARLRQVQELLGDRVGRDIFMYSISIDPENDTPERLAQYAQQFQVGPGWLFLTGNEEDITLLRKKLGLFIDEIQDGSGDHNVSLVVGNEATGRWMRRSPFDDPQALATTIGDWLHNWRNSRGAGSSYSQVKMQPQVSRGEYLFRSRCTACHTLGEPGELGPDLIGVSEKRDRDWLIRWIASPDVLLAEGDPIALQIFEQYQQRAMPNLGLNESDVTAVLEFIDRESEEHLAATRDHGPHH